MQPSPPALPVDGLASFSVSATFIRFTQIPMEEFLVTYTLSLIFCGTSTPWMIDIDT
jgi:hypothetical protein